MRNCRLGRYTKRSRLKGDCIHVTVVYLPLPSSPWNTTFNFKREEFENIFKLNQIIIIFSLKWMFLIHISCGFFVCFCIFHNCKNITIPVFSYFVLKHSSLENKVQYVLKSNSKVSEVYKTCYFVMLQSIAVNQTSVIHAAWTP